MYKYTQTLIHRATAVCWHGTQIMCANTVNSELCEWVLLPNVLLNHMEESLCDEEFAWGCLWLANFECLGEESILWFMIHSQKISFLSCDIELNHTFSPFFTHPPTHPHAHSLVRVCMYVIWVLSSQENFHAIRKSLDIIIIPLQYCHLARVEHSTRSLS